MIAVESIAEKVNQANHKLYVAFGVTRLTETWVQWGISPDSTDQEIDAIINDYVTYRQEKGAGVV